MFVFIVRERISAYYAFNAVISAKYIQVAKDWYLKPINWINLLQLNISYVVDDLSTLYVQNDL